jgi:hypothetical protein
MIFFFRFDFVSKWTDGKARFDVTVGVEVGQNDGGFQDHNSLITYEDKTQLEYQFFEMRV